MMFSTLRSSIIFTTIVSASAGVVVPQAPHSTGCVCTVLALGNQTDDTPQILAAFEECNNGGTVVFPETENYWIATKLNPVINNVTIDWKGTWTVSFLSLERWDWNLI